MRVFIILLILLLLFVGIANSTESAILKNNLVGWKGISLWCDMKAIPASEGMDHSGYICAMFYGEFSRAAKQQEISFVYVQTDGEYTSEKLLAMGYLPIQVKMQASGDQFVQAKLVSDISIEKPLVRTIRIYENPIFLKGNPFIYGKQLISFFQKAARTISRDLSLNGGANHP